MKLERKIYIRKLVVLIGATLVPFVNGVTWLWGNLAAYVSSYFKFTFGSDYGPGTAWTIPVYLALFAFGPTITEFLMRRGGHQLTMLTSILLYNASLLLCSVTVKHSVPALVVTMGALTGIASGILYGQGLWIAAAWKCQRKGSLLAFTTVGYMTGSVFTNEILTYYINPNNKPPNVTIGQESYFTQAEIIERVPSAFLVFGGVCFAWQLVLYLIMFPFFKDLTSEESSSTTFMKADEENMNHKTLLPASAQGQQNGECNEFLENSDNRSFAKNGLKGSEQKSILNNKDVTGIQMIKTPAYLIILLCYISTDLSVILVHSYYKIYGEQWIKDDHFITNIGIVTIIMGVIANFVFGAFVDYMGVKNTLVLFHSFLCLTGQLWYFAPMVNKWLYMASTTAFRSMPVGLYVVFTAAILAVFGKTYFARNYSILMSMSVAVNLFGPFLMQGMLDNFGWFPLIFSCSLMNFISLCTVIFGLPRL